MPPTFFLLSLILESVFIDCFVVSRSNFAGTGGVSVSIVSSANWPASSVARFGFSAASSSAWISSSSIVGKSAGANGGFGNYFQITAIGKQRQTLSNSLTLDNPALQFVILSNVPVTSGISVTTSGINFFGSNISPSRAMSGTAAEAAVWLSATSLSSKVSSLRTFFQSTLVVGTIDSSPASISKVISYNTMRVAQAQKPFNTPTTGAVSISINVFTSSCDFSPIARGFTSLQSSLWISESSCSGKSAHKSTQTRSTFTVSLTPLSATLSRAFSLNAASISSLTRTNFALTGGVRVTVFGSDISMFNLSPSFATEHTSSESSRWISTSAIQSRTSAASRRTSPSTRELVLSTSPLRASLSLAVSFPDFSASSAAAMNIPTSGAVVVSISAVSLGTFRASIVTRIETSRCEVGRWSADSSVTCKSGSGGSTTRRRRGSVISITPRTSTITGGVSYNAPNLSSPSTGPGVNSGRNVPATGGISVLISGANFGRSPVVFPGENACDVTHGVRLQGSSVENVGWISDSGLRLKVESGVRRKFPGNVLVSAPTTFSVENLVTFDGGVVASVVGRRNIPATGGLQLTLSTLHGGVAQFSSRSRLSGTASPKSVWVSHSSLTLMTIRITRTISTNLGVTLQSVSAETRAGGFSLDLILASDFRRGNLPPSGGVSATIIAVSMFGGASVGARFDSTSTPHPRWRSDSAIVLKSTLVAGSGPCACGITLQREIPRSTVLPGAISIDVSVVFFLDPNTNAPTTGAVTCTIIGLQRGVGSPSTFLHRTTAASSQWGSTSSLLSKLPSSISVGGSLAVTLHRALSNTISRAFTFNAAVTPAQSRGNLPISAGVSVTIFGTDFGSVFCTLATSIGGTPGENSRWGSTTGLRVRPAASGATGKRSLANWVSILDGNFHRSDMVTLTRAVSVDIGIISNGITSNSPASGAMSATIIVASLGSGDATAKGRRGGSGADNTRWICSSSLRGKIIAGGRQGRHPCAVTQVVFLTASETSSFSFDSLTPITVGNFSATNSPRTGGVSVTLIAPILRQNISPFLRVGPSSAGRFLWLAFSSIVSKSPPSAAIFGSKEGATLSLSIAQLTPTKTISNLFSFSGPAIFPSNKFSANSTASTGSTGVTVTGILFGISDSSISAALSPSTSQNSLWISTSTIFAKAGSATGFGVSVKISIDTIGVGTATFGLTVEPGMVLSVRSRGSNKPTTGAVSVSVVTIGFGYSDYSSASRIGKTAVENHLWVSTSSVRLRPSSADTFSTPLVVSVLSAINVSKNFKFSPTISNVLTFDAPVVISSGRANFAPTGAILSTIFGSKFFTANISPAVRHGAASASVTTSWVSETSVSSKQGATNTFAISLSLSISPPTMAGGIFRKTLTNIFSVDFSSPSSAVATNFPLTAAHCVSLLSNGFSPLDASPVARFSRSSSEGTKWGSSSALQLRISPFSLRRNSKLFPGFAVTSALRRGSLSLSVSLDFPKILFSKIGNSPTTGAVSISIFGSNCVAVDFSAATNILRTGGEASSWTSQSSTSTKSSRSTLRFRQSFQLTTLAGVSSISNLFSSDFFSVGNSSKITNVPATGSISLSLSGKSFSTIDPSPHARFLISAAATATQNSLWISETSLKFKSPAALHTFFENRRSFVGVSLGTVRQTARSAFVVDAASTTFDRPAISPVNSPSTGAVSVSLSVSYLSSTDESPRAYISPSGSGSHTTTWISSSSLSAKSSSLSRLSRSLSLSLSPRTISTLIFLSGLSTDSPYFAETPVSAVFPPTGILNGKNIYNIPGTGSTYVYVSGYFSPLSASSSARLHPTSPVSRVWIAGTALGLKTAAGGYRREIVVSVGYTGTSGLAVNFDGSVCGDGVKNIEEGCDDGGVEGGDGCDGRCKIEAGYTCTDTYGTPSICTTTCGDAKKSGLEGCDDGNLANADGCSSSCTVEAGYTCVPIVANHTYSEKSICSLCGDGTRTFGGEGCDDGNLVDNDGCSSTCTVEAGFVCPPFPSAKDLNIFVTDVCVCAPNMFGPSCKTYCEPTQSCNGNGTCNANGGCNCFRNFFGGACGTLAVPIKSATQFVDAGQSALLQISDTENLRIPTDATSAALNFTLDVFLSSFLPIPPSQSTTVNMLSDVISLGPDGTVFRNPVQLTLSFSTAGDIDTEHMDIYFYNHLTNLWESAGATRVDTQNRVITSYISHFTNFALVQVIPVTAAAGSWWTDLRYGLVFGAIGLVCIFLFGLLLARHRAARRKIETRTTLVATSTKNTPYHLPQAVLTPLENRQHVPQVYLQPKLASVEILRDGRPLPTPATLYQPIPTPLRTPGELPTILSEPRTWRLSSPPQETVWQVLEEYQGQPQADGEFLGWPGEDEHGFSHERQMTFAHEIFPPLHTRTNDETVPRTQEDDGMLL